MVKMVKMSKNCKHFNFEAGAHEAASRQGLHFRIPPPPPILGSFMVDAEL